MLGGMARHFAGGGLVGGFVDAVNLPGLAEGGMVRAASPGGGGDGGGRYHLDLRTDKGTFPAQVSADTLEAVRTSALGIKLTSTGPRPSWF
jgi:hypothetical protein